MILSPIVFRSFIEHDSPTIEETASARMFPYIPPGKVHRISESQRIRVIAPFLTCSPDIVFEDLSGDLDHVAGFL
jgi:hypothetical protein